MDLLRAAYLLELELDELVGIPAWRRRDLEIVGRASVRAMREAAETIERLRLDRTSMIQVAASSSRRETHQ